MTKNKTHLNGMTNINPNLINDGLILSEKCKRDITAGVTLSLDNYIAEFNRILETARREAPEAFKDIADASDTSAGKPQKTRSQLRVQTLYAIDLANDKLVSRLTGQVKEMEKTTREKTDCLPLLEKLFDRFHQVVRQLRSRHRGRPTLDVEDAADIRDLTRALLAIYFDNIDTGEWTPSYAAEALTDFLLPDAGTVICVKKSGEKVRHRQIEEQVLADIAHYREKPGYHQLVCFVYDPGGMVAYPTSLETYLETLSDEKFKVKVFINPK
jgi:DpnII restriction endonuclease